MKFTVEPRLLDHFGVAMYNTVEKAIGELVANAYDADATEVRIEYTRDEIVVTDNGIGMTPGEVESAYLRLGHNRREDTGQTTPGGRPVIGNKGIGKLAGFGIAQRISVLTSRDGKRTAFTLDRRELEAAGSLEDYEFDAVITDVAETAAGTEVRLQGLLPGVALVDDISLRAALARQLPARVNWRIVVNDQECTVADVPGDRFAIADKIQGYGRVDGFYVVAESRRDLSPGFAVRIRGRIVQDQSLFGLNQQQHGFFSLTRIVGELEPDFIDPVDQRSEREDFVINTSRTALNRDFPSVQALEQYARDKLTSIAEGLTRQRARERKRAALERNPEYEERLKALGPEIYAKLDALLDAVIGRLAKNESKDTIDQLVDLIIRYYESDAVRLLIESVRYASDTEIERLAELLVQYGAARIGEVASILHSQLEVIELLQDKVRSGALERDIHKIIAQNVWLVREGLTYWFDNRTFATQLADRLAEKFTFASGQRPDLACYDDSPLHERTDGARRLVVVEFKRPGIEIGTEELMQVFLYKKVFQESLGTFGADDIEVIILGDRFDARFDREGLGSGYTVMSYMELLEAARRRYRDLYESLAPPDDSRQPAESQPSDAHGEETQEPE